MIDPTLHILDDDDGVVDDDADGQHEAEERKDIQREAGDPERGKSADEGDGNGNERDDGRAPVLQEDEHDDGDEPDTDEQGLDDIPDTFPDEPRGVVGHAVIHARGEALLQLEHLLVDRVGGLESVCAGQLEDGHGDGRAAVVSHGGAVVRCGEFGAADVAEARHAAVIADVDDHVVELGGVGEAALDVHRVLELRGSFRQRRPANDAGGDLHVLLGHGVDDVVGGEASCGQLVGVEPEAHRVVAHAEDIDVADTRETRDLVLDLERGVVAEEDGVVRVIRRKQRDNERDVGRRFFDRDALALDLERELGLGDGHPILHLHLGDIEIRAGGKGDGERHVAVVGRLAGHVEHVLDAVDLLLQRRGHGLRDGQGIGAGIAGGDGDRGGRDLGILIDRQADDREGRRR